MTKPEEVKEKIIEAFVNGLNQHLFASDTYPERVTIKTEYKECMQTITIEFDGKIGGTKNV